MKLQRRRKTHIILGANKINNVARLMTQGNGRAGLNMSKPEEKVLLTIREGVAIC
jgi:hypothetical protein